MTLYDETRVSIILCVVWLTTQGVVLIFGLDAMDLTWAVMLTVVLLIIFVCIFSLRVVVDRDSLTISYGLGLWSRSVPLEQVQGTEVVANSYWTWLYDPRLEHVLRIRLRDGSKVIVGVGDAKRLAEIVNSQRH